MSVKKTKIKKNSGFTLIELVVVFAILSILALLVIPKFMDVLNNTRTAHDLSEARELSDAVGRSVASGDYRLSALALEKYNSGSWEAVTDIITEMETHYISPVGSPKTGDKYVVKITDGKVMILVDDTQIYP
ncbi:type II secretion system protein [Fusibacter sp. 3D3]|uniref:type II secretion system protein n=1 Tax=Fusibacter sp. 3D3 TaxID=1048380 RepID=UPI000853ED9E|nr:prepilin-type N-terminal cleavage/methylation domain-containing protein [Fusibacter sp. 3D3]GAU79400.1 hypothetical protein F3D3_4061 [Fusibacter sp. 3D3]